MYSQRGLHVWLHASTGLHTPLTGGVGVVGYIRQAQTHLHSWLMGPVCSILPGLVLARARARQSPKTQRGTLEATPITRTRMYRTAG